MVEIDECADMIRRGEYEKAVLHLSRITTSKPNDPEANILKGLALYSLGRYPEALEDCRVAMNYGGDLSEKYEELWHLYEEAKMHDEASEYRLLAALMDEIILKAAYVRAKALFSGWGCGTTRFTRSTSRCDWIRTTRTSAMS